MTLLVRFRHGDEVHIGVLDGDRVATVPVESLSAALRLPVTGLRELVARASTAPTHAIDEVTLLPPVDGQEVWAAGVTYFRSRTARLEESGGADVYERVYEAERPELFFKSPGWRVVGPDEAVGVRADSAWNLPEPELSVVVNAHAEVVGFTVGNDVSTRDIEGANSLYLPQAKVYRRSCALGPGIRPAWELDGDPTFAIEMSIRRGDDVVAAGAVDTSLMVRTVADLVSWLWRCLDFPDGVVLMTGTGIVPDASVSLTAGDEVAISIEGIGTLRNPVIDVG